MHGETLKFETHKQCLVQCRNFACIFDFILSKLAEISWIKV